MPWRSGRGFKILKDAPGACFLLYSQRGKVERLKITHTLPVPFVILVLLTGLPTARVNSSHRSVKQNFRVHSPKKHTQAWSEGLAWFPTAFWRAEDGLAGRAGGVTGLEAWAFKRVGCSGGLRLKRRVARVGERDRGAGSRRRDDFRVLGVLSRSNDRALG